MKKIFIITMSLIAIQNFIFPNKAYPIDRRIYCKQDGVIIEHRVDENYTDENKQYDHNWFIVNESQIPHAEYPEQLRCSGNSLTVDSNFKPEWAVKKEQLAQTKAALDAELGKAEPDIVTVLRLQRAIEKIKE